MGIFRIACTATILVALTGCIAKPTKTVASAPKTTTFDINMVFGQNPSSSFRNIKDTSFQLYDWHTSRITMIDSSDDGKYIASATKYGNSVIIWNTEHRKPVVQLTQKTQKKVDFYDAPLYSGLAFSPDSRYLAFGSHDQVISIWDIKNKKISQSIKLNHIVTALSFSPDGNNLAYTQNTNSINILRLSDSKTPTTLTDIHGYPVNIVKYDSTGNRVVTVGQSKRGRTKYIKVWDISSKQVVKTISVFGLVSSLEISPDDRFIVATLYDKNKSQLATWRLDGPDTSPISGFKVHDTSAKFQPHVNLGHGIDFSNDGKSMISGVEGYALNIWDVKTLKLIKRIKTSKPVFGKMLTVKFSNSDNEIITIGPKETAIRSWHTEGEHVEAGVAVAARLKRAADVSAEKEMGYKAKSIRKYNELKKNAKLGVAIAEYNLARCYHQALGYDAPAYCTEKNFTKALDWYKKAAEHGHASSQSTIGYYYLNGIGLPKDYSKAGKWLRKAKAQGDLYAAKHLKLIEHKIQIIANNKKLKDNIAALLHGNPKFKRCYEMISNRLTTCIVSTGMCDSNGCGNETRCDRKSGKFVFVHPCEYELNTTANENGTYYCDGTTLQYSKNKDRVIMNECTY